MPTIANLDPMSHIISACFVDDVAVFADAEGLIKRLDGKETHLTAHDGMLAAERSQDGKSLVSVGEDGRVIRTSASGECSVLGEQTGKWIDRIATGPNNAVAWASGKQAFVLASDGATRELTCERSIEGLAFAPKGMRLAMARYNGVDLAWVNTSNPPVFLEWKGAHTGVSFSPDGKYVVSTMQENALHGWRIIDNKHMRMSGYPTKVKSVSWSAKGKWLATSGAPAAIVWPFSGKDGPMGKQPLELGSMGSVKVTCVSCHPNEDMLAIGYEDGMILAVRLPDGKEVVLRRSGKGAVSTMGWDKAGKRLAFGSEEGDAGIIDLTQ